MDEAQLKAIQQKMDLIARLLALNLIREAQSDKERIVKLSSAGFRPTEIAVLLKKQVNTVNVRLSEARKEAKKPRTKRKEAH